tara:strand:+ start:8507 stop:9037 length:531 start_codon:yes stop_codon:yes gene_type:complete
MKTLSPQQITIIMLVSAISYLMYTKYCNTSSEPYADYEELQDTADLNEAVEPVKGDTQITNNVKPYVADSDKLDLSLGSEPINLGKCGNGGQFISSNLLPKNDPQLEDSFSDFKPSLEGKNFVDAYKFVFGSQSQSLRNPNYQLRSDPMNPQENVCPWMQSTIYPEKRRALDIGAK